MIRKTKPLQEHTDGCMTRLISYQDDGIIIEKQNGMTKTLAFDTNYNMVVDMLNANKDTLLTTCNDWFKKKLSTTYIDISDYKDKLFEYRIYEQTMAHKRMRNETRLTVHTKPFKICDLFKIVRGKRKLTDMHKGQYPFVSSKSVDNGIVDFVDIYDYEDCITVANNGSVGSSFYQKGKFCCSSDVTVLTNPIKDINQQHILLFICSLLERYKSVYNYGTKWSLQRMKYDTIDLPVNDEVLDFTVLGYSHIN